MYEEAQRTGFDVQDVDKVTSQVTDEQRDAKEAHKLEAKLRVKVSAMIKRGDATQLACLMLATKIQAEALMIGEFNQICSVIGYRFRTARRDSRVKDMMPWIWVNVVT